MIKRKVVKSRARGTILGTIPIGMARRMVLRLICGLLSIPFLISVQLV